MYIYIYIYSIDVNSMSKYVSFLSVLGKVFLFFLQITFLTKSKFDS